ncbi:unnamed protein product [Pylaiella littoralis]
MNDAGYESHMVGKWHLGNYDDSMLSQERGFKTSLGFLSGAESFYSHENLGVSLDGKSFVDFGYGDTTGYHDVNTCDSNDATGSDGGDPTDACYNGTYSEDVYFDRATQIVQSKKPYDDEPLFLYMAHQSVHSPNGPAPSDGFTTEEQQLLDAVSAATGSDERVQFAGVLLYLDKLIGDFVDVLEDEGWLENSIIVVASDNGGCPTDGGTNYPLRGAKGSVHEGGTKVPAFVYSKSHLPSQAMGTTYDNLMHVTDWLPTLANVAGAEITDSAGALDGVDQWGSLKSYDEEAGDSPPRTEMLYNWDPYILSSQDELTQDLSLTQGAFRSGDWKLMLNVWCEGYYSHDLAVTESDDLVESGDTCGGTTSCEACADRCEMDTETYGVSDKLYNIVDDPREQYNLYDEYPEIVETLLERAETVVFGEYVESGFEETDTYSYTVWAESGYRIVPWKDEE